MNIPYGETFYHGRKFHISESTKCENEHEMHVIASDSLIAG